MRPDDNSNRFAVSQVDSPTASKLAISRFRGVSVSSQAAISILAVATSAGVEPGTDGDRRRAAGHLSSHPRCRFVARGGQPLPSRLADRRHDERDCRARRDIQIVSVEKAGNRCEVMIFEGKPHGFFYNAKGIS